MFDDRYFPCLGCGYHPAKCICKPCKTDSLSEQSVSMTDYSVEAASLQLCRELEADVNYWKLAYKRLYTTIFGLEGEFAQDYENAN